MEATAEQRRRFGGEVRRLRNDKKMSAQQLADALAAVLPDQQFSFQKIGGWERGEYAPRQRAIVDALEQILDAVGGLAPLLGFGPLDLDALDRIDAIERRMAAVEELLSQIAEEVRRRRRR